MEILVVMVIIGILLGISTPAFVNYMKQARLKSVTRELVGLVSLARNTAISSHEEVAVVIGADDIRIVNQETGEALDQRLHIPSAVEIEVEVGGEPAAEPQLVFKPTGSLAGRSTSLIVRHHDRSQTITVSGVTGAVTLQ